jgi:hypothetical protein
LVTIQSLSVWLSQEAAEEVVGQVVAVELVGIEILFPQKRLVEVIQVVKPLKLLHKLHM